MKNYNQAKMGFIENKILKEFPKRKGMYFWNVPGLFGHTEHIHYPTVKIRLPIDSLIKFAPPGFDLEKIFWKLSAQEPFFLLYA